MMGCGALLALLGLGGLAYYLGYRPSDLNEIRPGIRKTPLDILKERYARGEITKEQFEEMRRDLET